MLGCAVPGWQGANRPREQQWITGGFYVAELLPVCCLDLESRTMHAFKYLALAVLGDLKC